MSKLLDAIGDFCGTSKFSDEKFLWYAQGYDLKRDVYNQNKFDYFTRFLEAVDQAEYKARLAIRLSDGIHSMFLLTAGMRLDDEKRTIVDQLKKSAEEFKVEKLTL